MLCHVLYAHACILWFVYKVLRLYRFMRDDAIDLLRDCLLSELSA